MAVFPTLDFMQVKARYPKAVEKITEWLFNQPELQSATNEFIDPKHPEESKEQFTGLMIQMDPRKLYDIFDSLEIHIGVTLDVDGMWECKIGKKGNAYYFHGRHEAEVTAFYDAFDLLENQLA